MGKQNRSELTPVRQLGLFVRKAKGLKRRSCFDFISNYRSSVTMSWKQGENIQISNLVKPDEESYRSYLIDFRQFLLNDSPVQVNMILNMAINRARHIAYREELIKLQFDWKEIKKSLHGTSRETEKGTVQLHTGYEMFLMWLNGTIFHYDVDAENMFSSLGILMDEIEVEYSKYVGLCSNFIIHLAAVIESGLNTDGFDLLNQFTPHTHPKVVVNVANEEWKAAIIKFWKSTKRFPQTLSVCEEHGQDTVIFVEGFNESTSNLQDVKVELRSCCQNAVNRTVAKLQKALAWIEYAEKNGPPLLQESIEILEVEITDLKDMEAIRTALADYCLIWRRKVGKMRCAVHNVPPGARGFGVDIYHQGTREETNSVFLQGCCHLFIGQVLNKLKQEA
jgi:hypothetical protein